MATSDFVAFQSPLLGKGKEHFRAFCEKYNLDFEELHQQLTAYFATFPAMIHVQANERHRYISWGQWISLSSNS